MENHYRELLRFLSARLGDRQAAADVAHDAYLRVLERSSQARIEHPRAFLYRTALNLAVDEHRRSRVRKAEPLRPRRGGGYVRAFPRYSRTSVSASTS